MRLRVYYISPEHLMLCLGNRWQHFCVHSDIPPDAEVMAIAYSRAKDAFVVMVAHESFEETPVGELPPIGDPPIIERLDSIADFLEPHYN